MSVRTKELAIVDVETTGGNASSNRIIEIAVIRVSGGELKEPFSTLINPETFPDWCRSRGLNIDAQARNLFAAEAAKDEVMSAHAEGGGLH